MPSLVDGADPQVFEHHVRALEQPEKQLAAFRPLQIDRDAPLVAIQIHEVRGFVAVERRSPRAGDVAVDRFDLDDVGAVVAEHGGREGSGQRMRQVEHHDIAEGRGVGHCSTAAKSDC